MLLPTPFTYLAVLLVLTWWIARMIRPRWLRSSPWSPGLIILGVLGLGSLAAGAGSVAEWTRRTAWAALACCGILGVAVAAGMLRARTVRLWGEGGQVWRQGSWVTVLTWCAWAAVHYVLDRGVGLIDPRTHLASSTLWAGVALSLAAQGRALRRRAAKDLHP